MKAEELVNNFEDFYGPYTDKKRLIMISKIKRIVKKGLELFLDDLCFVWIECYLSRRNIPSDNHNLKIYEQYLDRPQSEPYLKTIENEDPSDPIVPPEVASKELIKISNHLLSLGARNGK